MIETIGIHQPGTAVPSARRHIEQCRREVEAAWIQIEAARDLLQRTRWLLARWAECQRVHEHGESERLKARDRSEAARIGMLVPSAPQTLPPRRDRNARHRTGSPQRRRQLSGRP
ncbi:MAG TPA: hypothetical protein VGF60_11425 [Xanthobacteraceae bacterium]|jgi:hypothetical protein